MRGHWHTFCRTCSTTSMPGRKSLVVQVPSEGIATARQRYSRNIYARSRKDETPEKEMMLECDEVEAEIDVADFENVRVQLEEESDMMLWAHYMHSDVQLVSEEQQEDAEEAVASHSKPEHTSKVDVVEEEDYDEFKATAKSDNPVLAESSAARFFGGNSLPLRSDPGQQNEWDLRAFMEKKKWFQQDEAAWQKHRDDTIGRYASMAADWRTDARIQDCTDPAGIDYREWTMKEIWDLITQNGEAADPRDVPFKARKPGSLSDLVGEGFVQHPNAPDWLEAQGRLLSESEETKVDEDVEGALLTSEFSDFDADFDFES